MTRRALFFALAIPLAACGSDAPSESERLEAEAEALGAELDSLRRVAEQGMEETQALRDSLQREQQAIDSVQAEIDVLQEELGM